MTKNIDFTAEEWKKLLQTPGAAGINIMMADLDFVVGSIIQKGKENNSDLLAA